MGTWYDIDESKTRTFDDMMEEYFSMIDDKPSTIERKEDAFVHLIITFMLQCHANPHAPLAQ
jgi:hypothetical protein